MSNLKNKSILYVRIFAHEEYDQDIWNKRIELVNRIALRDANLFIVFDIEQVPFTPIKFGSGVKKVGKRGLYYYPQQLWYWLQFSINAMDCDVVVASYTDKQWLSERRDNHLRGQSKGNMLGVSEIIMAGTDGEVREYKKGQKKIDEWVARFLHELSHSAFDHLMKRPDLDATHDWHYDKRDLSGALKEWRIPYNTKGRTLLDKTNKA